MSHSPGDKYYPTVTLTSYGRITHYLGTYFVCFVSALFLTWVCGTWSVYCDRSSGRRDACWPWTIGLISVANMSPDMTTLGRLTVTDVIHRPGLHSYVKAWSLTSTDTLSNSKSIKFIKTRFNRYTAILPAK